MVEFLLELKHISGKKNRVDPLSRRPDYRIHSLEDPITMMAQKTMKR